MFPVLLKTKAEWVTEVTNELIDLYSGKGIAESIKPLLTLSGDSYSLLLGSVKTVYYLLAGIGASMIVLYFIMDIIQSFEHDNLTLEFVIRKFIGLAVAACLIGFGYDIVYNILRFGDALLTDLVSGLGAEGTSDFADNVAQMVSNLNLNSMSKTDLKFMKWIDIGIPKMAQKIGMVAIAVAAYSRAIEFFVRFLGVPLAVPNIFQEGVRSPGVRYLKKLLAVAIQGFVMFAIVHMSSLVMSSMMFNGNDISNAMGFFAPISVTAVQCTLIMKSQNFANDIVGV